MTLTFTETWYPSEQLEDSWQLLPGGPDYTEECEYWQYMGSRFYPRTATAIHTFRHRCYHNERRYVRVIDSELGTELYPDDVRPSDSFPQNGRQP